MTYNFRDRTGERYGKLTVIERAEDAVFPSAKLVQWKCQCECGRIKIIAGCNLPKVKSCGCQMNNRKKEDLTGRRFGIVTVKSFAYQRQLPCGQKQTMWVCECDCGNVFTVRAATLKNGATRSCGCVKSHGERLISEILSSMNISFRKEFSFADCLSSSGKRVKYDFAVFDKENLCLLIEYQGEQHYYAPEKNRWFGALQRDETDQIKKEYCMTHSIPLYEIRYDEDIASRIRNILQDNTVPSLTM